jgi:hypothetical protein
MGFARLASQFTLIVPELGLLHRLGPVEEIRFVLALFWLVVEEVSDLTAS